MGARITAGYDWSSRELIGSGGAHLTFTPISLSSEVLNSTPLSNLAAPNSWKFGGYGEARFNLSQREFTHTSVKHVDVVTVGVKAGPVNITSVANNDVNDTGFSLGLENPKWLEKIAGGDQISFSCTETVLT